MVFANAAVLCNLVPTSDSIFDLVYNSRVLADSDAFRHRFKIIARDILLFHIH